MLETIRQFRQWFWKPPRAHGQVIVHRRVSNLELLYDLVYVAVISQAASALAADVSMPGLIGFIVVFGLIWIGWVNGSLYLELHGQEDGRTRSYVFIQMGILALLAVFTHDATHASGDRFAITYAAFVLVVAWLFMTVKRVDTPEVGRFTGAYALVLGASALVIAASALLPPELQLVVWAGFGVTFIALLIVLGFRTRSVSLGVTPTDSMVERFGIFVIIVLGEVIVGIVDGLSHASVELPAVGVGILALGVGLGFWWIYFDIVGSRKPHADGRSLTVWILTHLPITGAIAAAGAGMVSLIEHATDLATPPATAWLLAGSTALLLLAAIVNARSLADYRRLPGVYRALSLAMLVAAAAALALALLLPPPWLLALGLGAIQLVLWFVVVAKFMRVSAWPPGSEAHTN